MSAQTDGGDAGHSRREFMAWAGRRGIGLGLLGASAPGLLAACAGADDDPAPSAGGGGPTTSAQAQEQARKIVGDVIEFSLSPQGWTGNFGFVTMRLHKGAFEGRDVY